MITGQNHFAWNSIRKKSCRRGITLVEAAISLAFICTLIIGALDFSIASFRSELLNHVAHKVGRAAVIHGTYAPSGYNGGTWGPSGVVTTLKGTDPVAGSVSSMKSSLNHVDVTILVTWPNGTNTPGSPVVVEARTSWAPMFLESMGFGVMTLRGKSYQVIQH